jgi:hypothetical protein
LLFYNLFYIENIEINNTFLFEALIVFHLNLFEYLLN